MSVPLIGSCAVAGVPEELPLKRPPCNEFCEASEVAAVDDCNSERAKVMGEAV